MELGATISSSSSGLANNEELVFGKSKNQENLGRPVSPNNLWLLNLFVIQQDTPSNMKLGAERQ